VIFSSRRKPGEKVRTVVLCALFTGVETAFLACGALGNTPSFGEDQVPVQGHRSYHQRPGVPVEPVDQKTLLEPFGAELSRVPEVVRHQLVLNHNEGLAVDSVKQDSQADRIGLKPHDILVQFDEQYLLLPEQFSLLLQSYVRQRQGTNNKGAKVIFIRSGERRVILLSRDYQKQVPESQLNGSAMRNADSRSQRMNETSETQPLQVSRSASPSRGMTNWNATSEPVVLLREDADYIIRLTQGKETRLQVHSLDEKCIFDELLISQEPLLAIPQSIRDRVNTMLHVLESHAKVIHENTKRSDFTEDRTARLPTVDLIEKQPALRP
tara:strand:- start:2221 stop:3195 length:975 start_codon:yes stop_codon:yes gene_type:complete